MKFDFNKINVSSALKYRLMFILGGIAHSIFLLLFLEMNILPMVFVNVASISVYVLESFFSVRKSTGTMKYGWMLAFYSEIVIHSLLCTLLLGWNPDFHLYLIAILPLAIYVLFFSCGIERFLITVTVFCVIDIVAVTGAGIMISNSEMLPYYPLSYDEVAMFSRINTLFVAVLLVGFALLFALEIHGLLRDLNETNQKLEYIATHDKLTGLLNRHSLRPMVDRLEVADMHYCVVLGDIDDFKKVNDTYGHDCGDLVLKTVADTIKDGISEGDIVCRWGGEEILLVLLGTHEECYERIRTIREAIISREIQYNDISMNITLTFGFADCCEAFGIEKIVTLTDKRLYKGKTSGKNVIIAG